MFEHYFFVQSIFGRGSIVWLEIVLPRMEKSCRDGKMGLCSRDGTFFAHGTCGSR